MVSSGNIIFFFFFGNNDSIDNVGPNVVTWNKKVHGGFIREYNGEKNHYEKNIRFISPRFISLYTSNTILNKKKIQLNYCIVYNSLLCNDLYVIIFGWLVSGITS